MSCQLSIAIGRHFRPDQSGRGGVNRSDQLDRTPGDPGDQSQAKGDVRPACLALDPLVDERITRPGKRVLGSRALEPLVRMPDAEPVAIVEESLEQARPV